MSNIQRMHYQVENELIGSRVTSRCGQVMAYKTSPYLNKVLSKLTQERDKVTCKQCLISLERDDKKAAAISTVKAIGEDCPELNTNPEQSHE